MTTTERLAVYHQIAADLRATGEHGSEVAALLVEQLADERASRYPLMDKKQAQRAVFQLLRRKAVNSAPKAEPVNKAGAALVDAAAGARNLLSKLESRIEITDELCEEIKLAESALWDALFPGAAASAGGGQ